MFVCWDEQRGWSVVFTLVCFKVMLGDKMLYFGCIEQIELECDLGEMDAACTCFVLSVSCLYTEIFSVLHPLGNIVGMRHDNWYCCTEAGVLSGSCHAPNLLYRSLERQESTSGIFSVCFYITTWALWLFFVCRLLTVLFLSLLSSWVPLLSAPPGTWAACTCAEKDPSAYGEAVALAWFWLALN